MKLRFHPEAATELKEAVFYYENCQIGLGRQLNHEIKVAAQLITAHSLAWTILATNIRRILIRRFPYALLYTIKQNEIYILAVMHLNREPNYWQQRE